MFSYFPSSFYYLYLIFLYRCPSSQDCSILGFLSDSIDRALYDNPSSNIVVCNDFNIHHFEWLGSADTAGLEAFKFSVSQNLSQIVDFPTRFPDNDAHSPSLLDLYLILDLGSCKASRETLIGSFHHLTPFTPFTPFRLMKLLIEYWSVYCTSYKYQLADWDSLYWKQETIHRCS